MRIVCSSFKRSDFEIDHGVIVIVHKTDGVCDIYNDGQVEAKMVGLAFCFVSAFVELGEKIHTTLTSARSICKQQNRLINA